MEQTGEDIGRRPARVVLILLLLAAAALRVTFCWSIRFCAKPDFGIVALMTKHMAEGRDFPLLFYGHGYGGTLESMVGVAFSRLLGPTAFAVLLGTALCGFLALPAVYGWGRAAAGRRAGLAAVCFLVIAPFHYLFYTVVSVGTYACALTSIAYVLWQTPVLVAGERAGRPFPPFRYLLLGLAAGLGWWTSQLVSPAFLVAALVFLLMGRRTFRVGTAGAGLLGFLVGSFPFWWWNATHGWETFALERSFRPNRFLGQLRTVFVEHLPGAAGLDFQRTAGLALLLLVLGIALAEAVRRLRREGLDAALPLGTALLFVAGHGLVLSVSHFGGFNTPRYLLPAVPAFAVLLGAATNALSRRLPRGLAWLLPLAVVLPQLRAFPLWHELSREYRGASRDAARLVQLLDEQGINAVYTDYSSHELNFFTGERLTFSDLVRERYGPYAVHNEASDRIAILNNCRDLATFLDFSGGTARRRNFDGRYARLDYGFAPPDGAAVPLAPGRFTVRDASGADAAVLTDGDADTSWTSARHPDVPEVLLVRLDAPTTICGFRLWESDDREEPLTWRFEGRATPDGPWRLLSKADTPCYYFWSGPRPYWGGRDFRLESRVAPVRVTELRITSPANRRARRWSATELEVLAPAPGLPELAPGDLRALWRLQLARGWRRVYADRWLAAALHRLNGDAVATPVEGFVYGREGLPSHVALTGDTALVVPDAMAGVTRDALARRDLKLRETICGPWTAFDFAPTAWRDAYGGATGLRWVGPTCLLGFNKPWAQARFRRATRLRGAGGAAGEAESLLEEALAAYPEHEPAARRLAERWREAGEPERADALTREVDARTLPAVPFRADFANGASLRGITLAGRSFVPGETLSYTFYWKLATNVNPRAFGIFVHFRDRDIRWQDDHVLPGAIARRDVQYQPFDEVFAETREVRIPPETPPGVYSLSIGLVDPRTGRRIRVRTDLPAPHNAATPPIVVRVGSGGG